MTVVMQKAIVLAMITQKASQGSSFSNLNSYRIISCFDSERPAASRSFAAGLQKRALWRGDGDATAP